MMMVSEFRLLVFQYATPMPGLTRHKSREVAFVRTQKPELRLPIVVVAMSVAVTAPSASFADEGGVSFWYPGTYGSLAAERQEPGWSLSIIDYHATVSAEGFTGGPPAMGNGNYNEHTDQVMFGPTYVFATPFLGAQVSVGMSSLYGRDSVSLTGLTGAGAIPESFAPADNISESATGFGTSSRCLPCVGTGA